MKINVKKTKTNIDEDIINYKDIQNTHEIICDYFNDQKKEVSKLKHLKKEIDNLMEGKSRVLKLTLKRYQSKIKEKIDDIKNNSTYNRYLKSISPILNRYREYNHPIYGDNKFNVADVYVKWFNDIARRFFPVMTLPQKPDEGCLNCNSTVIFNNDTCTICRKCRYIVWKQVNNISYDDKERVNLNSRYKYVRELFFKEAIKKYQGQQRDDIPEHVRRYIDDFISTNDIKPSQLTKHRLWSILKDGNYSKYNEYINKIYYEMVNKPPPDISKYENELLSDFRLQDDVYNEIDPEVREYRDNALNSFYILFKLLEKYGYHVTKEEKDIFLKDRPRLISHDKTWKEICEQLGWNYLDTV